MKILNLRAENIGKLKVFEVDTDGKDVIIGGKNGAGKSTVMKAIEMLLEGKRSFPEVPVRAGEEEGSISAELEGGFLVERTIRADGRTEVIVKNKEGARYGSPQTLLDGFRGANTLDPLSFLQLKPLEQADRMRALVGVDTGALDDKRKAMFDERTVLNRSAKEAQARLASMTFHGDAPDEEVSSEELTRELEAINERIREHDGLNLDLGQAVREMGDAQVEISRLKSVLAQQQKRLEEATEEKERISKRLSETTRPDASELKARIAEASAANEKVRANKARAGVAQIEKEFSGKADTLTASIEKIDSQKTEMLAAAKFPVEGLSFGESGLTFNGIPFSQASQAEKLRVSTAMAFAANPKLKVVLIRDGSLLDEDNLKLVCDVAREHGGHVWIERVGNGEECSIVLEDGEVKSTRKKS